MTRSAAQPAPAFDAVNHDDAIERIFAHMEVLKTAALAAGDEVLLKQIDAALQESLERYCDAKRLELDIKLNGKPA